MTDNNINRGIGINNHAQVADVNVNSMISPPFKAFNRMIIYIGLNGQ